MAIIILISTFICDLFLSQTFHGITLVTTLDFCSSWPRGDLSQTCDLQATWRARRKEKKKGRGKEERRDGGRKGRRIEERGEKLEGSEKEYQKANTDNS